MTQHPSRRTSLSTPMTAIAIAVLLAACGGGGSSGSDRKVSSSPSPNGQSGTGSNVTLNINAGTGAIADAITSGNGPSTTTPPTSSNTGTGTTVPPTSGDPIVIPPAPPASNDQGSTTPPATGNNAGGTTGTGNQGSSTSGGDANATPPATVAPGVAPLVSDQGVRGDVLVAMFDQNACQSEFSVGRVESLTGPSLTLDGAVKIDTPPVYIMASLNHDAYTYDMDKWKIDGRHPPARAPGYVYRCHYPDIRSYSNPVKPGDHIFTMVTEGRYHTFLTSRYYGSPYITKGVNQAEVEYPITVSDTEIVIRGQAKLKLKQDMGYKATTIAGDDVPFTALHESWLEGTARSYSRQGVVPFGAINQWQSAPINGETNKVQLLLIKADEPNTVRLCTHLHTWLAQRLHCVTWQVPTDWSWGKELKGGKHYLIEDRTPYSGETGFMFWR